MRPLYKKSQDTICDVYSLYLISWLLRLPRLQKKLCIFVITIFLQLLLIIFLLADFRSEIYRLNLSQGRFLNSLQTNSPGVNRCEFNKIHYLFTCGTEDGRIEAWDPRSRHRVGVLDCAMHMDTEYTS